MRTLIFAIIVIILAMMVSALTLLRTTPVMTADTSEPSVFSLVAMEMTDGEEVFNRVCSTCHMVDRPAEMETEPIAPPMKMIVKRYTMATETTSEAHARIVEWLVKPDAEKSLLPAMAIEHHGLMPPVVLTDEERAAVADFVLELAEPKGGMMGNGEGMKGCKHDMGDGEGMKGCKHDMGDGEAKEGMKCKMKENGEGMKGCKHDMKKGEGEGEGHQHKKG